MPFRTHKLLSERKSQERLAFRSSAVLLRQLGQSAVSFHMAFLVCFGNDPEEVT